MNYELAKKLKDAGFPMKENYPMYGGIGYVYCGVCKEYMGTGDNTATAGPTHCGKSDIRFMIIPTLTELIETCGDGFGTLQRMGKNTCRECGNVDPKFDVREYWIASPSFVFIALEGETPEEAVANLWLELNKK